MRFGSIAALSVLFSLLSGCGDTADSDFEAGDDFGAAVVPLGDVNADGRDDIAVGESLSDTGAENQGAVILFQLEADGLATREGRIAARKRGFRGNLDNGDNFGAALARLGDLDGDGTADLAVGAPGDDDGASSRGALWVLFLDAELKVKSWQKISSREGEFVGTLREHDLFGSALAGLVDLDGDGVQDMAVGAPGDGDGGQNSGAVWILFLNSNGTVKSHQKISSTAGAFGGTLAPNDRFGSSLAAIDDLDGDGVNDLAVGAPQDDDGGSKRGAVWILFLETDGTVREQSKISATAGGFTGALSNEDDFGGALSRLGDLNGDGTFDLAVGAAGDGGDFRRGAVWILFLEPDGSVQSQVKINGQEGGFGGDLDSGDHFGTSLTLLPDLNSDSVEDLAVGADGDGRDGAGAVWLLRLQGDGTVLEESKIRP